MGRPRAVARWALHAVTALVLAGGCTKSSTTTCAGGAGPPAANGQACGCGSDCKSGFCVDGVCCDTACTDTCKACDVVGATGTCTAVPPGEPPRAPRAACVGSDVATCGLDGTCDGKGSCRRYPAGTVCRPGTCQRDAVDGVEVCDGKGACKPGPATICAPFGCDSSSGQCFTTCQADDQCASEQKCVNGSCGEKPRGASCAANAECASGFCTDGVCCNVDCGGACVTCNQVGRLGTCWAADPGARDPRGICKNGGIASCGQTGTCDGFGLCAKYPAETICLPPYCTGDQLSTAGTCDGLGNCRPRGSQNCEPFGCFDGACNTRCTDDTDCQVGHACVNGSCGPKQDGQPCAAPGECASGFCVDGVCCGDACPGPCTSCALASSPGKCTAVVAGAADPRATCVDERPESCGTDGRCDGLGACRKYRVGTFCAPQHCDLSSYTGPSVCTSTGACMPPAPRPCTPFACNGDICYEACTQNSHCAPPFVCNGNSCGKKDVGASCSDSGECGSGNCAQGTCCSTTCAASCMTCALPTALGTCSAVPADVIDPVRACADTGAGSCGTTGLCDGRGGCAKRLSGIQCGSDSCVDTTHIGIGSCDGAGACMQPTMDCADYRCGTDGLCLTACAGDLDCTGQLVCTAGACVPQ
jgi:hypothetical protein